MTTLEQNEFISQHSKLFSQLLADLNLQIRRAEEDHARLQERKDKLKNMQELWKMEDEQREAAKEAQAQTPIEEPATPPSLDFIWKREDENHAESLKLIQEERESAYTEKKEIQAEFIKNITSPHFKAIAHFSSFAHSAKYELSSIATNASFKLEEIGRKYIFRKAVLAIQATSPVVNSFAQSVKKAAKGIYETGENMARSIYRSVYPLGIKFEEKFQDLTRWIYRTTQDLNPFSSIRRSMELEVLENKISESEASREPVISAPINAEQTRKAMAEYALRRAAHSLNEEAKQQEASTSLPQQISSVVSSLAETFKANMDTTPEDKHELVVSAPMNAEQTRKAMEELALQRNTFDEENKHKKANAPLPQQISSIISSLTDSLKAKVVSTPEAKHEPVVSAPMNAEQTRKAIEEFAAQKSSTTSSQGRKEMHTGKENNIWGTFSNLFKVAPTCRTETGVQPATTPQLIS